MPNLEMLKNSLPIAPLKILALESALPLGEKVNNHLVDFRKNIDIGVKSDPAFQGYEEVNYMIDFDTPRFGSGEGKCVLGESVRGKDLFILVDVCNHTITYRMNQFTNHKSPDDHYQDLKRVIAAASGHRASYKRNYAFFVREQTA